MGGTEATEEEADAEVEIPNHSELTARLRAYAEILRQVRISDIGNLECVAIMVESVCLAVKSIADNEREF